MILHTVVNQLEIMNDCYSEKCENKPVHKAYGSGFLEYSDIGNGQAATRLYSTNPADFLKFCGKTI